jgi:hypothetical protein
MNPAHFAASESPRACQLPTSSGCQILGWRFLFLSAPGGNHRGGSEAGSLDRRMERASGEIPRISARSLWCKNFFGSAIFPPTSSVGNSFKLNQTHVNSLKVSKMCVFLRSPCATRLCGLFSAETFPKILFSMLFFCVSVTHGGTLVSQEDCKTRGCSGFVTILSRRV